MNTFSKELPVQKDPMFKLIKYWLFIVKTDHLSIERTNFYSDFPEFKRFESNLRAYKNKFKKGEEVDSGQVISEIRKFVEVNFPHITEDFKERTGKYNRFFNQKTGEAFDEDVNDPEVYAFERELKDTKTAMDGGLDVDLDSVNEKIENFIELNKHTFSKKTTDKLNTWKKYYSEESNGTVSDKTEKNVEELIENIIEEDSSEGEVERDGKKSKNRNKHEKYNVYNNHFMCDFTEDEVNNAKSKEYKRFLLKSKLEGIENNTKEEKKKRKKIRERELKRLEELSIESLETEILQKGYSIEFLNDLVMKDLVVMTRDVIANYMNLSYYQQKIMSKQSKQNHKNGIKNKKSRITKNDLKNIPKEHFVGHKDIKACYNVHPSKHGGFHVHSYYTNVHPKVKLFLNPHKIADRRQEAHLITEEKYSDVLLQGVALGLKNKDFKNQEDLIYEYFTKKYNNENPHHINNAGYNPDEETNESTIQSNQAYQTEREAAVQLMVENYKKEVEELLSDVLSQQKDGEDNSFALSFEEKKAKAEELGFNIYTAFDGFDSLKKMVNNTTGETEYLLNIEDFRDERQRLLLSNPQFGKNTKIRRLMHKTAAQRNHNNEIDESLRRVERHELSSIANEGEGNDPKYKNNNTDKNKGRKEINKKVWKDFYVHKVENTANEILTKVYKELDNKISRIEMEYEGSSFSFGEDEQRKVANKQELQRKKEAVKKAKLDAFYALVEEYKKKGLVVYLNAQGNLTFYRMQHLIDKDGNLVLAGHKYKSSDLDIEELDGRKWKNNFDLTAEDIKEYQKNHIKPIFPYQKSLNYKMAYADNPEGVYSFDYATDIFFSEKKNFYKVFKSTQEDGKDVYFGKKGDGVLFVSEPIPEKEHAAHILLSMSKDDRKSGLAVLQSAKAEYMEIVERNKGKNEGDKEDVRRRYFREKDKYGYTDANAFIYAEAYLDYSNETNFKKSLNIYVRSNLDIKRTTIQKEIGEKIYEENLEKTLISIAKKEKNTNKKNNKQVYEFKTEFFANYLFDSDKDEKLNKTRKERGLDTRKDYYYTNVMEQVAEMEEDIHNIQIYDSVKYFQNLLESENLEIDAFKRRQSKEFLVKSVAQLNYIGIFNYTIAQKDNNDYDLKKLIELNPDLKNDIKRETVSIIKKKGERYAGQLSDVEGGTSETNFDIDLKNENVLNEKLDDKFKNIADTLRKEKVADNREDTFISDLYHKLLDNSFDFNNILDSETMESHFIENDLSRGEALDFTNFIRKKRREEVRALRKRNGRAFNGR